VNKAKAIEKNLLFKKSSFSFFQEIWRLEREKKKTQKKQKIKKVAKSVKKTSSEF
jgi:hypothetical protein